MAELEPGSRFAGYLIERRLGKGGMGVVYSALEEALDRRIALKLIASDVASDPIFLRRFAEESRTAASIEHPNVIPIYAVGEEQGIPWLAMRHVTGSDLARRIVELGKLDPADAARITAQVGAGLDALHKAGLIHRDVKPGNVLLAEQEGGEEMVYLTDFGLAKNVASTSGFTRTGKVVGTLDYISPEQISGRDVDARADIYALGCMLYKTLTGRVPFPRADSAGKMFAHLNDLPPKPSDAGAPALFDPVIERAMAKEPDDRFPSAGDLGRAAMAAAEGGVVELEERTVATGIALTGDEQEALVSGGVSRTVTAAPTGTPTAVSPPTEVQEGGGWPRWLVPAGAGAAVVAVAAVLLAGGGGGGGGAGREGGNGQQGPERLTQAALVAQTNGICIRTRQEYNVWDARAREATTPEEARNPAQQMVRVATEVLDGDGDHPGLRDLTPPAATQAGYRAYIEARQNMLNHLIDGRNAAMNGDLAGFQAGLDAVQAERGKRYSTAREAGLVKCTPTR
jgi:protein kinase-like protein